MEVPETHQQNFDLYLNSLQDEFTLYDSIHKKSQDSKRTNEFEGKEESALVECYERVAYLYFENNFVLDFGELSRNCEKIREKQEELNEELDLVEINLFTQIHHKFHDYFKVVANFDYLSQSLLINIGKIK